MGLISSGGGSALSIPFDLVASGAELSLDNAGNFTLTGKAGNIADLLLLDTAHPTRSGELRSSGVVLLTSDVATMNVANEAGTAGGTVSPKYGLLTFLNAAPADGDLFAGACALWYDKTNGASKLMVKAKQADGTVKTASVALA